MIGGKGVDTRGKLFQQSFHSKGGAKWLGWRRLHGIGATFAGAPVTLVFK